MTNKVGWSLSGLDSHSIFEKALRDIIPATGGNISSSASFEEGL